jgi:hypothetical protein
MTDEERVEAAVACLAEFFDTVQVFTSKHVPGQDVTYKISCGCGNMLARMYQTETWLGEQSSDQDDEDFDDDDD